MSPERAKLASTGDTLREKGRAGRTVAQIQEGCNLNAFSKSSVGLPFELNEQHEGQLIVLPGMNYDCEEGGAEPEEFDDEIRHSDSEDDYEDAIMDDDKDYGDESEEGESEDDNMS